MTLLEAFLFFRMPCTDPALSARNDEAGAVLLQAQRAFGAVPPCTTTSIQDIRQDVLIRVGLKGPRYDAQGQPLPEAPTDEGRVRRYLWKSVYRGCVSWLRREHPEQYSDDDPDLQIVGGGDVGAPPVEDRYGSYEVFDARLHEHYVPQLSQLLRDSVQELLRIRRHETTVPALIDADSGSGNTPFVKLRSKRYRRYFDAVKTLHRLVDEDPELTSDDRSLAHRVVDDLRIQEAKPRRAKRIADGAPT